MDASNLTREILELRPILKTFTLRFTRDHDESLDLVQDTMLKALTYKHKFTQQTNLKGWLFTIMRNTFINQYRRTKRFRVNRDDSVGSYFLNVKDDHTFTSPEKRFEYLDIWKNVNSVREDILVPFKMFVSGYKYHEIAQHLNLPIGTVKNRIFQARKEIQKSLVGY
jgi:RNA polymerase sigma factor (sigma-70 family)